MSKNPHDIYDTDDRKEMLHIARMQSGMWISETVEESRGHQVDSLEKNLTILALSCSATLATLFINMKAMNTKTLEQFKTEMSKQFDSELQFLEDSVAKGTISKTDFTPNKKKGDPNGNLN